MNSLRMKKKLKEKQVNADYMMCPSFMLPDASVMAAFTFAPRREVIVQKRMMMSHFCHSLLSLNRFLEMFSWVNSCR